MIENAQEWDRFTGIFPNSHILQSFQWAQLKSQFGWTAKWVIHDDGQIKIGAQILFRRVLPGVKMAYIAKGPLFNTQDQDSPAWTNFWGKVDSVCKKDRAFMLKVEPDIWINHESVNTNRIEEFSEENFTRINKWAVNPPKNFSISGHSIQPSRTLIIDIRGTEDEILARMKQKTRYNIKLAQKKNVTVKSSPDFEEFSHLMEITGVRDGFGVHESNYYKIAYEIFAPRNECQLLIAEHEGKNLAAIMVFANKKRAWYLYGASSNEKRELMPTYILQWEAIRWARNRGCSEYDLWGVPDENQTQLEEQFLQRNEGLWGVYRFKRGFGGDLFKAAGPWDRIYNPLLYKLYKHRVS